MDHSILLKSGNYLDLAAPDPDLIKITDIAAALSKICRFTGHTKTFYSVAQHCIFCHDEAPDELKWHALMHDAAEAYIGDVSSPLKGLLPDYRDIERNMEAVIFTKYNVKVCERVKELDIRALLTEKHYLMPDSDQNWEQFEGFERFKDHTIFPCNLTIERAEKGFLDRAMRLV